MATPSKKSGARKRPISAAAIKSGTVDPRELSSELAAARNRWDAYLREGGSTVQAALRGFDLADELLRAGDRDDFDVPMLLRILDQWDPLAWPLGLTLAIAKDPERIAREIRKRHSTAASGKLRKDKHPAWTGVRLSADRELYFKKHGTRRGWLKLRSGELGMSERAIADRMKNFRK